LAAKAEARPAPRPATLLAGLTAPVAAPDPAPPVVTAVSANLATSAPPVPETAKQPAVARSAPIYDDQSILAAATSEIATPAPSTTAGEVVTRLSTSGGKHWGVNVGRFKSSDAAERVLVKTQLVEGAVLGASLRKVTEKGGGFDANFLGLSQEAAELACRRLIARSISCVTLGP
jgi:D-alanyl-D-alanine carboxypeptidase